MRGYIIIILVHKNEASQPPLFDPASVEKEGKI